MSGNPSGLAADVYSFGLILWELCTLKTPYANLESREDLFPQKVATDNVRPSLRSIRSRCLRKLISRCWDPSPLNRPTFTEIQRELLNAILLLATSKKTVLASNTCKEESSSSIVEQPQKIPCKLPQSTTIRRFMRSLRSIAGLYRHASGKRLADNHPADRTDRHPPAIDNNTSF